MMKQLHISHFGISYWKLKVNLKKCGGCGQQWDSRSCDSKICCQGLITELS